MTPADGLRDALVLVAGFAASAFALVRLSLAQQRALTDRFVSFLEQHTARQAQTIDGFRDATDALKESVQENTRVVRSLVERFGGDEEAPWRS